MIAEGRVVFSCAFLIAAVAAPSASHSAEGRRHARPAEDWKAYKIAPTATKIIADGWVFSSEAIDLVRAVARAHKVLAAAPYRSGLDFGKVVAGYGKPDEVTEESLVVGSSFPVQTEKVNVNWYGPLGIGVSKDRNQVVGLFPRDKPKGFWDALDPDDLGSSSAPHVLPNAPPSTIPETPNAPPSKPVEPELRPWTDISGTFRVEAAFLHLKEGKVTLRRKDGTTITIPLERLDKADQAFVQELKVARQPNVTPERTGSTCVSGNAATILLPSKDSPHRLYLNSKTQRIGLPVQSLGPNNEQQNEGAVWASVLDKEFAPHTSWSGSPSHEVTAREIKAWIVFGTEGEDGNVAQGTDLRIRIQRNNALVSIHTVHIPQGFLEKGKKEMKALLAVWQVPQFSLSQHDRLSISFAAATPGKILVYGYGQSFVDFADSVKQERAVHAMFRQLDVEKVRRGEAK
jgi:hypothetical protein